MSAASRHFPAPRARSEQATVGGVESTIPSPLSGRDTLAEQARTRSAREYHAESNAESGPRIHMEIDGARPRDKPFVTTKRTLLRPIPERRVLPPGLLFELRVDRAELLLESNPVHHLLGQFLGQLYEAVAGMEEGPLIEVRITREGCDVTALKKQRENASSRIPACPTSTPICRISMRKSSRS